MSKETYLCALKRTTRTIKQLMHVKRDASTRQQRPTCMSKETYRHIKRDVSTYQKRRMYMSKETYYQHIKRDQCIYPRKRINMSKEMDMYVKRNVSTCQKKPMHMSKETYPHVKRDQYMSKKTCTTNPSIFRVDARRRRRARACVRV